MKTKRAKATDIPQKVKRKVWERDNHCCIICGSPIAAPNAHYISRANGGLGIEENILTMCTNFSENMCHFKFDNGTAEEREEIRQKAENYLRSIYPEWDPEKLFYKKYDF